MMFGENVPATATVMHSPLLSCNQQTPGIEYYGPFRMPSSRVFLVAVMCTILVGSVNIGSYWAINGSDYRKDGNAANSVGRTEKMNKSAGNGTHYAGPDLANAKELQGILYQQRQFFQSRVHEMYGEKYAKMLFGDLNNSNNQTTSSPTSRFYGTMYTSVSKLLEGLDIDKPQEDKQQEDKPQEAETVDSMVRKFQIKILQAQLQFLRAKRERTLRDVEDGTAAQQTFANFTWVNGGHR